MSNLTEIELPKSPDRMELLEGVVASLDHALVATDQGGRITLWNPAAEELYGYSEAEALGRSMDFVVPEGQRRNLAQVMTQLGKGQSIDLPESVHVHRSGRLVDVSVKLRPMLGPDGEPVGAVALASDSSQHRRVSERLWHAFESSPSGMVIVDENGIILMVNAETERLFGYTRQDLLGRKVDMLVPAGVRARHQDFRANFASSPSSRLMGGGRDLHGQRQDGSEFPVEIGLNPIRTRDGLLILGVIADISERKHAEERFRLALESAPCGIAMVDPGGKILLVNLETERLFGYERGSMTGMNIDQLVPQRYRAHHQGLREGFGSSPEARTMGAGRDLFGLRRDGSEFPVEIGLNPIRTAEGVCVLAAILDITERKQTAETLAQHAEELRRSNADLEQFAYVASHDLQEPLRMVASYVELLEERYRGQLDEKADKYIHYAVDGAKRMKQLVSDLLSFSRVGTQGKPLQSIDSGQVLRSVMFGLRPVVEESGAQIQIDPLPWVMADDSQLRQLLQNLLSNAIKFRGDHPPQIRVAAEANGREWVFSVADNGIGMDTRYSDKIFQMFQRLHERGRYEGSGIGLAIAKRIVERHGGRIWFDSQPEKGTTFYFTMKSAGEHGGSTENG